MVVVSAARRGGGRGLNQFICLLRCCGLSFFLVMFLEG